MDMMRRLRPHEYFADYRPRKGDKITYRGQPAGTVERIEDALCYRVPEGGGPSELGFIWCFKDGLNNLHDWPSKDASLNCGVFSVPPERDAISDHAELAEAPSP